MPGCYAGVGLLPSSFTYRYVICRNLDVLCCFGAEVFIQNSRFTDDSFHAGRKIFEMEQKHVAHHRANEAELRYICREHCVRTLFEHLAWGQTVHTCKHGVGIYVYDVDITTHSWPMLHTLSLMKTTPM